MQLIDRINADLKTAMLGGNKTATETLRMLKSAISYASTQEGNTEITEPELIKIIRREVKKRTEAADSFRKAASEDRAAQEEQEAEVLKQYLPAQTDPSVIEAFITELRASNPDLQKGDAIRQTLAHFEGQADGKTVSEIVSRIFA